ncbi:MAG: hypothetical protein JWR80_2099 [Bradyrhizobium sp.]|nr:hypothetical protein [Bradyrhizobium sp.]
MAELAPFPAPLAAAPDPEPVERLRAFSRVFGKTRVLDNLLPIR